MNLKRRLLIGLLAFGTIAGFGFEAARFSRCHGGHGRHAGFGRHAVESGAGDAARAAPGSEAAP